MAENLSTLIPYGRINGKTAQGRKRGRRTDDIKDWTKKTVAACVQLAEDRCAWRELVSASVAPIFRHELAKTTQGKVTLLSAPVYFWPLSVLNKCIK